MLTNGFIFKLSPWNLEKKKLNNKRQKNIHTEGKPSFLNVRNVKEDSSKDVLRGNSQKFIKHIKKLQ